MKRPVGFDAPPPPAGERKPPREPGEPRTRRPPRSAEPTDVRSAARLLRQASRDRRRAEKAEVRRFTRHSRRRRIAVLTALAVVAGLAGIIVLGAFSPLFALRTIEVQGASRVDAAQVTDALSGELGTPLPLVDAGEVRSALAEFPLIESYTTESRPPGTLVVRIVERTPVAVLATNRGFELVDSAGVPLERADERIAGFPIVDLQGKTVDDVPFTAAAEVLVALPDELRAQVDTITARTLDDVSLVLAGGERVVWGSAADSVRKAQHLTALLQQAPTDVTEYDVSSPGVGILR
ncbi:FtsQ-type POTRA domain-containing protein [Naasia sp. SYSU D00057]|uniref:FtsQ-type POTRA domain-containing protein n=1 Tax=Naasia sp. SYSU D00057 TaxID=2817380 RepID=UPI001B303F55|nr:FtsQ-type POTRA domain-containing protein [Naasia sp. SYSU D00057]